MITHPYIRLPHLSPLLAVDGGAPVWHHRRDHPHLPSPPPHWPSPSPFVTASQSTAALPFGTIVVIILIWCAITIPLTVFGGIAGKNNKSEFLAPCRTNKYPREIPELPWYRTAVPQMIMSGFLPFSAIYVELYYIFASVWGHKVWGGTL